MREFTREKRLRTRSVNGTLALGETITELLRAPKLVVLRGELGAGKTTLVKGMAAALGAADVEDVASPTFTLVHEYLGRKVKLFHLDLYRLETEQELENIGLWEMADSGNALVLVEWGERFESVVKMAAGEIYMEHGEGDDRGMIVRLRE